MSPKAGEMLMRAIVPMIRAGIARGVVRGVGSEDREELTAECIAWAAKILHNVEASGRHVPARKVAYYAMKRTDFGERATSCSRVDVMAPGTHVDGKCVVLSMDAPMAGPDDDPEEAMTLHDVLASKAEDVAMSAGRRIDWEEVTKGMDKLRLDILCALVDGRSRKEVARSNGVSVSWVRTLKRRVMSRMRARCNIVMLEDATRDSSWKKHLRVRRERRACRVKPPVRQQTVNEGTGPLARRTKEVRKRRCAAEAMTSG